MSATFRRKRPAPWDECFTITKLDAAKRQLHTAIELWFAERDPVSVHTLAVAAYEIAHFVSGKRGRTEALIFDSKIIKPQYINEWNIFIKKAANFFKHANRDPDASIEFKPTLSEFFIAVAIRALEICGEEETDTELAFMFWLQIHRPELFCDAFIERIQRLFPVDLLDEARTIEKPLFLNAFLESRKRAHSSGFRRRLGAPDAVLGIVDATHGIVLDEDGPLLPYP